MEFLNTDDAPNLIAVRLDGTIERADMDEIARRVETIAGRGQKVRLYVEMESFPRMTWEALKEDLGLGLRHFNQFEAKAVVTDIAWTEAVAKVADSLFPAFHIRQFGSDRRDEALAWAKGPADPSVS